MFPIFNVVGAAISKFIADDIEKYPVALRAHVLFSWSTA